MKFTEIILHNAKLIRDRDKSEVFLGKVDFYFETNALLLKIASQKPPRENNRQHGLVIDKIEIPIEERDAFVIGEPYHMEAITLLTNTSNVVCAYKMKIPYIRFDWLIEDLLRQKRYRDGDYLVYEKLRFTCFEILFSEDVGE